MYVQSLPTEILRKRLGDSGNFLAQSGRIPGGAIKGTIDIAFAPEMLAESIAGAAADFKRTVSEMKSFGKQVDNLVKSGASRHDLAYMPMPSELGAINNNIKAWQAGDATALENPLPKNASYKPSANTSKPVTEWVSGAHQTVDNKTNSWVPEPQTKAAEFGSVVFDQTGRALPLVGASALKTGLKAIAILRGTPLSYAGAALQGIGTEGAEGSGQTDKMIISGLAEWASEKLGGKLFSPLAEKASSKAVSGTIDAVGEGLEENISGGIFSALTGTPYSLSDVAYDFAVGAAVGGAITTGVNAYNSLRVKNPTTANQPSLKNISKQNNIPISSGLSGLVGLPTNVPVSGTAGARLINLSGNLLIDVPTARMGQSGNAQQMQLGNIEIQGAALPSTPQTEPWKFTDVQGLRPVTPDESTHTNIIQFPKTETETEPSPQEQPGQIIPFPQTSKVDNQDNLQVNNQQHINLTQQISQPQVIPQFRAEQNVDIEVGIPIETQQTIETQTQSSPEIFPLVTTEVGQTNLPETTATEQPSHEAIATEQPQAQIQSQEQTQERASIRAAQIWSPAQAMLDHASRQNIRQRRDRDLPGYDFNLSIGQAATGRIYETSGYNATFGGLSSY